ncbi:MAG TPA: toll/interleukin-1 receptor domain-containing protein, partial [Blastocatellia bacterium]|nr:toll/interleukin-1 receptor domain-containing protein [Blastocatellia bacterium]
MMVRTTNSERRLQVFLCHSPADQRKVSELYERLKRDGVAPWIEDEYFFGGEQRDEEIRGVLLKSDVLIVCLSHSNTDRQGDLQPPIDWVLNLTHHSAKVIRVIPLRLDECGFPTRLEHLVYLNYYKKDGYERLIQALAREARRIGCAAPAMVTAGSPSGGVHSMGALDRREGAAATGLTRGKKAALAVLAVLLLMLLGGWWLYPSRPLRDVAANSEYIRRNPGNQGVIVFVHGILGDSRSTWTNDSTKAYWPELLVRD